MKSQTVRLLDVLVYGPLMIALATRKTKLTKGGRLALALLGVGTIAYNWKNYLDVESVEKGLPR